MGALNALQQQRSLDDPELLLGRPNDETKATQQAEKLAKLGDDLKDILSRQIRVVELSIRSEEQRLKSIPYDKRWPAQDRVKGLTADLERLRKEAEGLAKKVRDLVEKNELNLMQKGKAFEDLAEYGEKVIGHGSRVQIQQALSAPVYRPVGEGGHVQISSIVPLIVLACAGLKRLSEIMKSRAN